jgi:hypothetical protein
MDKSALPLSQFLTEGKSFHVTCRPTTVNDGKAENDSMIESPTHQEHQLQSANNLLYNALS